MQYYNNILTVEAGWLMSEGIITFPNYKQLSARGDIRVVRRGCRGTEALVDYESMPERFKRKIDAIVGDPYKVVRTNMIEVCISHSAEASDYFDNYMIDGERHLPVDKRREYYANAIILDAIHTTVTDRAAKRRALGHNDKRAWEQISEAVQDLDRSRYPMRCLQTREASSENTRNTRTKATRALYTNHICARATMPLKWQATIKSAHWRY